MATTSWFLYKKRVPFQEHVSQFFYRSAAMFSRKHLPSI
ncbi:hypothetical protein X975_01766, partial [Stegodyphus mimosarum]